MFIGYALDHEGDCYRMWNPKTNRVHETRDVVWLKRMYYETVEGDQLASPPLEIDADRDEPDIEIGESGVKKLSKMMTMKKKNSKNKMNLKKSWTLRRLHRQCKREARRKPQVAPREAEHNWHQTQNQQDC